MKRSNVLKALNLSNISNFKPLLPSKISSTPPLLSSSVLSKAPEYPILWSEIPGAVGNWQFSTINYLGHNQLENPTPPMKRPREATTPTPRAIKFRAVSPPQIPTARPIKVEKSPSPLLALLANWNPNHHGLPAPLPVPQPAPVTTTAFDVCPLCGAIAPREPNPIYAPGL
jgi:hypothetical protein